MVFHFSDLYMYSKLTVILLMGKERVRDLTNIA